MTFATATALGIGQPPSTLTVVLRQVQEALSLMADSTPVMIGDRYPEQGVGADVRILFIVEPAGPGRLGPPLEMGNAGSMTHTCNVHVRAPEGGEDLTRYDAVYALTDLVRGLIQVAATGCIEFGQWIGDSPLKVDGPGAGGLFSFTYTRDVTHSAARWDLPAATANTLPPAPVPPPGIAANEPTAVDFTVTPPT